MTQNIPLAKSDIAIEPFFDTVQEMLSGASPYFCISVVSATPVVTLRLAAGTGSTQQSISIDGFYRYRTTQIDATHPAGAAGTYDVYVTTGNNDFTGVSPNIDLTNYAFGFEIRASGSTPSTAHYRKVGETQWSGTAITGFRQLVGHRRDDSMVTPTASHATMTPLRVLGFASQSAALATFESNTNAIKASIAADGTINTVTGYQVSGTALAASHLSNGTTGTGAVALAGGPTFTGTLTAATIAATTFSGTPNFSGAATGQTAAVDTNTTQLATTAYVIGQSYLKSATAASTYQPLDGDLTSLAALAATGSVHRTAANTMAVRTLTGTTGQVTVTNGDGVAGNPTLSLPATITQATTFSQALTVSGGYLIGTALTGTPAYQSQQVAAQTVIRNKLLSGDANDAFHILGDGKHEWGPGGATALDTNFYRSAAAALKTDSSLTVGGNGAPSTGVGLELGWDGTTSFVQSYSRTSTASRPLVVYGSSVRLTVDAGDRVKADATGLGFYAHAPVAQQARPTTLNEVITVLANLGLTA